MIEVECECGQRLRVPYTAVGRAAACGACKRTTWLVAAANAAAGFDGRLVVLKGPQRAGEQFMLGGKGPIEIGKIAGKHLQLVSERVSRSHGRLLPTPNGWQIVDEGSTNGIFVNGRRILAEVLHGGELIRI